MHKLITVHKDKVDTSTEKLQQIEHKAVPSSDKVRDHFANERTFLSWMRTGLATITFGFVIERFGLVLRELGLKGQQVLPIHVSSFFGVSLTALGVIIMIVALINFLHNRRAIDTGQFQPPVNFAIMLTALASLIGVLLIFYLLLTP